MNRCGKQPRFMSTCLCETEMTGARHLHVRLRLSALCTAPVLHHAANRGSHSGAGCIAQTPDRSYEAAPGRCTASRRGHQSDGLANRLRGEPSEDPRPRRRFPAAIKVVPVSVRRRLPVRLADTSPRRARAAALRPRGGRRRAMQQTSVKNASEACGGAGDGGGNAIAAGRRRLTVIPTAVVDGLSISSWACFGRVSRQGQQGRPA